MKKYSYLFIVLALLISINVYAATTISGRPCPGGAASCTPSYGSEIATASNATDDAGGNETDATAGWANTVCSVFDSVTTDPQRGAYHLTATADSADDRISVDMSTLGLTAEALYRITFYAKHNGTGGNWTGKIASSNVAGSGGAFYAEWLIPNPTAWTQFTGYFAYNSVSTKYLVLYEASATNDGGIYIDNKSITPATICFGDELFSHSNAASSADTDATTGFSAIGTGVIESTTDDHHNGARTIKISVGATPADDGASLDIGAGLPGGALTVGKKYLIKYWVKGDGTNLWKIMHGVNTTNSNGAYYTQSSATWIEYSYSFVYNTNFRYLSFTEYNASDAGYVYVDDISVKEIVGE